MGTACILDDDRHPHSIRNLRTKRATAVGEMARMRNMFAAGSVGRFRVESLAYALNAVREDPRFTGPQKDAKFRSLLNRAR